MCFRHSALLLVCLTALVVTPVSTRQTTVAAARLGPVVEEIVVSVGSRFLTRSDLEVEARVALVMGGGEAGAHSAIGEETVASVLDYLVNQLLIIEEVERLQVFEVDAKDIASEYERFVSSFPSQAELEAFLDALGVGPERLAAIFRRNLRVQRFLESRMRLAVRVEEDEVVAFYIDNSERFPGRSLDDMRDTIRARLFRERFDEAIRDLIDDLRGRSDVRVLAEPRGFPALQTDGLGKDLEEHEGSRGQ